MPIDFAKAFKALKNGIVDLAEKDLKDYIAAATKDGNDILNAMKDDLKRWTKLLASGDLTKNDFTDLVLGQKDNLELVALKQAGLAEIAADQFKSDLFDLITNTIIGLIP
ncbi:MAG: hypothetical protein JWR38_4719 [Mucilaginibacter sp.]|nr:hypothetical protein [Mucilaginibacter sp.]